MTSFRKGNHRVNTKFEEKTKLLLVVTVLLLSCILFLVLHPPSTDPLIFVNIVTTDTNAAAKGTTTTTTTSTNLMPPETLDELLERHKKALRYYGNKKTNTGWYVDTLCLKNNNNLIVYGVGAGEDVSWDTSMVDTYGAAVHMFDPTEKSLKHTRPILDKYAHTGKLFHTPEGLSNRQGTLSFSLPANPNHVSMRQVEFADANMLRTVTVPVNTVQNWMQQRNHTYLDILKIDIEGSEYDVLESLLKQDFVPFTQLLVEYHDRFLKNDKQRHARLQQALQDAGFAQLWSQNGGQEVGYLKAADLPYCHYHADDDDIKKKGQQPPPERDPSITPMWTLRVVEHE